MGDRVIEKDHHGDTGTLKATWPDEDSGRQMAKVGWDSGVTADYHLDDLEAVRPDGQPKNTGEMQEARYLYAPRYRPPSSFTLPKGDWDLVENPKMTPFPGRRDLPLSKHNFGVVSYDRELTPDEIESYELDYLGSKNEMTEDGQSVEYKGWTITPWEGTQIGHGLPNSRNVGQQIGFHTHRKAKGYTLSHPDEGQEIKFVTAIAAAKKYIDDYGY